MSDYRDILARDVPKPKHITGFFHGGFGGLQVGQFVLPPVKTHAATTASYTIARGICDPKRVYVTTDLGAAMVYACMHPSGHRKIYEVEPLGGFEADPDATIEGLSYFCGSARVLRVIRLRGKTIKSVQKAMRQSL